MKLNPQPTPIAVSIGEKNTFVVSVLAFLFLFATAVPNSWAKTLPDFQNLVETYSPTVVNIQSKGLKNRDSTRVPNAEIPEFLQRFFQFEGPQQRNPGAQSQMPPARRADSIGSGVIVSEDGYILTNAHVIREAEEIIVRLHDRREFAATLIGSDNHSDIAVLKIDAHELAYAKLGDSDEVKVGQWVLAIGAPFGLEQTATQGIVSAVSRSLPNDTYVPFIQTDVALNPGNSGGPLFNLNGEVIGINSQIFSRTGGYMGLSFAIPINLAASIADQLKTNGEIQRGWLGIGIQELDSGLAKSFKLPQPTGALVRSVEPDSPAASAKLRSGDVILAYNGKTVTRSSDLPPLVASTEIGSTVPLTVLRDGKRREIEITVGNLRTRDNHVAEVAPEPLGIVVANLDAEEKRSQGLDRGVKVARVTPGKPAANAGINPNDIILSFDHKTVTSAKELASLAKHTPPGAVVPVLVQRENTTRFMAIEFPAA